jgi:hypothetical protein
MRADLLPIMELREAAQVTSVSFTICIIHYSGLASSSPERFVIL